MSCGNHHDTDCSEVLAEVWLFLDGECDAERRALLTKHLEECSPCLAEYGLDEKLKTLLATRCGGDRAPAALKDRLRQQIRVAVLEQVQSQVTVESVTVESGPEGTTTTVEVRQTTFERRT